MIRGEVATLQSKATPTQSQTLREAAKPETAMPLARCGSPSPSRCSQTSARLSPHVSLSPATGCLRNWKPVSLRPSSCSSRNDHLNVLSRVALSPGKCRFEFLARNRTVLRLKSERSLCCGHFLMTECATCNFIVMRLFLNLTKSTIGWTR